jgi:hypothetical protein
MTRCSRIHCIPLCTDNCMRQNTTKRDLSESLSVRSSHTTELLQWLRDYRLKAEFTLVRVADTPGQRKQVLPLKWGSLWLPPHCHDHLALFSARNNAVRLVKSNSSRPTGPGMVHKTSENCRSLFNGLRPNEVMFYSPKHCRQAHQIYEPGVSSSRGHTGLHIMLAALQS